jgi:hypothetical protein
MKDSKQKVEISRLRAKIKEQGATIKSLKAKYQRVVLKYIALLGEIRSAGVGLLDIAQREDHQDG